MINREKKALLLAVIALGLKIDIQATLYADNKILEIATQEEINNKVKPKDTTMVSIKNNGKITLKEEVNIDLSKKKYENVERFVNIDKNLNSELVNNGSIKVKDSITTASMQGGNFINNGTIELNDSSKGAILTNEGKIENNGTIKINDKSTGIQLQKNDKAYLKNNGKIEVSKESTGIQIDKGTAENNNTIIINGGDNANAKGVYLTSSGKFTNNKTIKLYLKKKKQKEKTKKKTDKQNPRTNGKSKAIQTKSHKEAYTYTLTKRKNIYIKKFKKEESNQINKQIFQ